MEQGERRPADLDGRQIDVRVGDDEILVSWHAPNTPPEGQAHGAEGICITGTGDVVVISRDGQRWELPAGRPEGDETWEQTLDGYERLEADMKGEFTDSAWWFDTAALTPERAAEQLVADAAHRAPILRPGWNAWLRQLHQM